MTDEIFPSRCRWENVGVGALGRWPASVVLLPRTATPAFYIETKLLATLNTLGPSRHDSNAGKRSRAKWLVGGENFGCLFGMFFLNHT